MKSKMHAFWMKSNPPSALADIIACDFIRVFRGFHPPARVDFIEKLTSEEVSFSGADGRTCRRNKLHISRNHE